MTKATAFGDLPPELQQQAQALHALVRRGKHADASDGLAAIVRDQKGFPSPAPIAFSSGREDSDRW
jgi:hypothetical protein